MALRNRLKNLPFLGQLFGQATTPPITIIIHAEPTLTIAVDKTDGYVGDTIVFSGEFRNDAGSPVQGETVTLYEGGNLVGNGLTDAAGYWMISWVAGAAGTYSFYAEATIPTL